MAFVSVPNTNLDAGDHIATDDITQLNDNIEWLKSQLDLGNGGGILNGSFEDGTVGAGNTPTNWTWAAYNGGTREIVSASGSDQQHGANALKITHPGGASPNGGGSVVTDDFIEVTAGATIFLAWRMKVSAANGAQNRIVFNWYQEDQTASATATTTAFSDTAGPTSWTQCLTAAIVPSDAKFCKVTIIGGHQGTTPSGSQDIYFDDVRFVKGPEHVYSKSMEFTDQTKSAAVVLDSAQFIWVEAWGGGGGTDTTLDCRGAGGAGYAAGSFFAAATTEYAVSLGAGGTSGGNGGNSTFNSTTIVATGGEGATNGAGNNGAGGTGGSGTITFDGQDGEDAAQGYGGFSPKGGGNSPGASATDGHYPGAGAAGKTGDANAGADGKAVAWFN